MPDLVLGVIGKHVLAPEIVSEDVPHVRHLDKVVTQMMWCSPVSYLGRVNVVVFNHGIKIIVKQLPVETVGIREPRYT